MSSNVTISGASFTETTVTVKLPVSVNSPSLTVTSIITSPLKFSGGRKLKLAPSKLTSPFDEDAV